MKGYNFHLCCIDHKLQSKLKFLDRPKNNMTQDHMTGGGGIIKIYVIKFQLTKC